MPIRNAEDEVRTVLAALGEALKRRDLDGAISLMTADVTFLAAKGSPVTGRDAVRTLYSNLFARFNITVIDAQCAVDVLGDAAVVNGQQNTTLASTRGARAISVASRTIAIFRRDDGSWRLARAISVMMSTASSGGTPRVRHVSELLKRAQAGPGRLIFPEVA